MTENPAPFNPAPPPPNNYFRNILAESLWDLYFYAQDDQTAADWPGFQEWLRTGHGDEYVPDAAQQPTP